MLSYKWPRAGRLINLILRPIGLIGTCLSFVVIVLSNYTWVIPLITDWTFVGCPASISLVGYAIGFFVALVIGRLPVDKAVTFGVQTGIANIAFALVMSSLMLPEPDGSTAFAPTFFFAVSSLIIAVVLIIIVAVGRLVYNHCIPKSFALSATGQRLEDEKRRWERTEKKAALSRSVSVISNGSGLRSTAAISVEEKNSVTNFGFDPTDVENGKQSAESERNEVEKKVVFQIA